MADRPIAFHPLSVIMETPNLSALLEKPSAKQLIGDLIDELVAIAGAQGVVFPADIKQRTIEDQLKAPPAMNIMHQDYTARRPLEIEIFLGSPIKIAKSRNIPAPHLNTLYPILHHLNQLNQNRPPPSPPSSVNPSPRAMGNGQPPMQGQAMGPGPRPHPNGMPPRRPIPPGGRGGMPNRGPPPRAGPPNGYPQQNGGYPPRPPPSNQVSRRNSLDDDLGEEFGHIALYGDMMDNGDGSSIPAPSAIPSGMPNMSELALRDRELALRERELMLRQQEMMANGGGPPPMGRMNGGGMGPMRGGRGGGRRMPPPKAMSVYDDDEDDDYYDSRAPQMAVGDVDSLDMMSVTSRRNKRLPSASSVRNNPEGDMMTPKGRHSLFGRNRGGPNRQSASARMLDGVPTMTDPLNDSLAGYSSNRYGTVDRKMMVDNSRANSMTSQRMPMMDPHDIRENPAFGGGAYPPMSGARRMSNSPGDSRRPNFQGQRGGYAGPDPRQFRGPPPDGSRPPTAGYMNGQAPPPHHVDQHVSDGVRHPQNLNGPSSNNVRSTTSSASTSLNTDSGPSTGAQNSAHSSSSSLEKRVPNGVAVR